MLLECFVACTMKVSICSLLSFLSVFRILSVLATNLPASQDIHELILTSSRKNGERGTAFMNVDDNEDRPGGPSNHQQT